MSQLIKRCIHCDQLFMPSKFHPKQQFCTSDECREYRKKSYKSDYNRSWREQNPNYFKEYWVTYRTFK